MSKSVSQSYPFDSIRQVDNDREYWSARDLQDLLGYARWENFKETIERAMVSCKNNEHNPSDHFRNATKVIKAGKGAEQNVSDYHLTRYGCYLTAMNGDPRKLEIAAAQGYFVVKTREAELGQQPQPQDLFETFNDPKLLRSTIEDLEDKSLSLRKMLQFLKFGEAMRYPCQAGRTRGRRGTPQIRLKKQIVGSEIKQMLLFGEEE